MEKCLSPNGFVYIGELHPFKQYAGTKARFETSQGTQEVTCFTHHISEFTNLSFGYGYEIEKFNEYFDEGDKTTLPRILSLLLTKK